jgi:hypothetical protein
VLVIRLDPAELGKIEVRLRMDEARQLSAEVTADQPATLDLLRRDSDNLTRALNDAGFRADDQSLRFDSRGFGQSDQHAQQGRRIASRAYLPDGRRRQCAVHPHPRPGPQLGPGRSRRLKEPIMAVDAATAATSRDQHQHRQWRWASSPPTATMFLKPADHPDAEPGPARSDGHVGHIPSSSSSSRRSNSRSSRMPRSSRS